MDGFLPITIVALVGYGLGSIPFGLLLTKAAGLGDIRSIGSGNIGATNVLRTGNKALAAATLVLDVLKGWLAVVLTPIILSALSLNNGGAINGSGPNLEIAALVAGVAGFIGHCYPVWLGFKGGKGVATFIGIILAWLPIAAAGFCIIWLITAAAFRYSSLAALVASACVIAVLWSFGVSGSMIGSSVLLVALLYWRHRQNIARLASGTESRIGQRAGA